MNNKEKEVVEMPEKKKKGSGRIRRSFQNQRFKSGAYSSFITVLVIAIVVVINLVFGKLDLSTDLSSGNLFTLSSDTENILKNASDDVTIYYMVEEGQEEKYIDRVLSQYGKISSHVKVKKIDPVVNPAFASKYVSEEISANDVIVVNDKTDAAKYVAGTEMYYGETDYSTYSQSYYLDVEGQVTSAIQSVLAEEKTKMYITTGHSERELGSAMTSAMEKLNVETEELALLTAEKIPEDCDILLINGPSSDLRDSEKKMVLDYLKAGGDAVINMQYTTEKTPNLNEILEYYGIQSNQGIICEEAGNYSTYPNWIVPSVSEEAEMVSSLTGFSVFPNAVGLNAAKADSLRSSLKLEELLTTTDGSYLKVDPSSGNAERETGDIDGPFAAGISAVETLEGEEQTQLVVYASADAFDDSFASTSQLDNGTLMKNAVRSMVKSEVEEAAIDVRSLSYSYISMTTGTQILWAAVLIIIIPVSLLAGGFAIWMARRKK